MSNSTPSLSVTLAPPMAPALAGNFGSVELWVDAMFALAQANGA